MLTGFDLCRAAMAVTDTTAPEQSVLLVLALMANDVAQAWPPVAGEAGLCAKTRLSERSVQRAIQRLCELGHISRRQVRHGVIYTVHPLTPVTVTGVTQTGDSVTPVTETPDTVTLTPATVAPKQPRTTSSQKASPSSKSRVAAAEEFPRPEYADRQHWADFLRNRKKKRLPNTPTAHAKILADVARLSDDEWPPGRIIQAAAERGWAGIYDPRDRDARHGTRPRHNRPSAWAPRAGFAGLEPASLDDD